MCVKPDVFPLGQALGQAKRPLSQKDSEVEVCLSLPSVLCLGGSSLPRNISAVPWALRMQDPWISEPSNQGVFPGQLSQKPGHQPCVRYPSRRQWCFEGMEEGEHKEHPPCEVSVKDCSQSLHAGLIRSLAISRGHDYLTGFLHRNTEILGILPLAVHYRWQL